MFKKIIILIFCLINLPVFAGVYEDALSKHDKVFLYLYTPDCRICKKFDVTYNNVKNQFKDFEFVKVNADTLYGNHLMRKFDGRYVPYVILTNSKTKKNVNIRHSCVMDDMCLIRALKSFNG